MKGYLSILCLLSASLACANANTVALVIGGVGGGNSNEIVTENGKCTGTTSTPKIPNAPAGNLIGWFAEYVDNKIYLCGGQDSDIHKDCYTLSVQAGASWSKECAMVYDRRYAASTALPDGSIVVLGGYNNKQAWLDSVEVKKPGGCEFTEKTEFKMPRKMFDLCAAAINNTHVFIVGGSLYGQPQVDNVDILDMTTGTWHPQAPLSLARSAPGCILTELNGEQGIMVTGGLNSEQLEQIKRTEFFNLKTQAWTRLEDMVGDRMGHKMFHVGKDKSVVVVGGYSQFTGQLDTIENYTPGVGWSNVGDLEFARYQYGGVAVPDDVLSC